MATKVEKRNGNYRARVSYVDECGKQKFKSFTAPTAKEANYLAAQYELERTHKSKPENVTLREAMERFIDNRENILSPSTVDGYHQLIRNAYGAIIDVRLGNLTQEHIQKAINDYSADHEPKTVLNALAFVSTVLKEFFPSLYTKIDTPMIVDKEIIIPSTEQVDTLLVLSKGKEIHLPILLGARLGLSRSEVFGLSWASIDLANDILTVKSAMVQDEHNAYVLKGPKTRKRHRTLDLGLEIKEELQGMDKSKPLFTMTPSQFTDRYRWLAGIVGAPLGFHTLRHYNASIMALLGVPRSYAIRISLKGPRGY